MADASLLMSVDQVTEAVGGICLCNYSAINGFSSVATDSRKVVTGSLFVPLMGEFQDGHSYIPKALAAGATVVFVNNAHGEGSASVYTSLAKQYGAAVVMVENTLTALQAAAQRYVSYFPSLLKIGVTGSSGKTTTKEILGAIFSQRYSVIMNEGNLNSETGLPLSVFTIRKQHTVGIFELGMNRRGEIREIAGVLSPSLALITNIGTAHIGILGSQRAIAEEKKQIFAFFSGTCVGFVPESDPFRDFLTQVDAGTVKAFGLTTTAGYQGSTDRGIEGFLIAYEGLSIAFPLPGKYNLANALGAIALARHVGFAPREIKAGLESVRPLFGRAEILHGKCAVVFDCYNANPDSMASALDFVGGLEWSGRKYLVLASMLELGAESAEAHRRICSLAAEVGAAGIFLFGDDMVTAGKSMNFGNVPVRFFEDITALSACLAETVTGDDLVFMKGSRGMALERVCPALGIERDGGASHA